MEGNMTQQTTTGGTGTRYLDLALIEQVQEVIKQSRQLATDQAHAIGILRIDRDKLRQLVLRLADIITASRDVETVEAGGRELRAYYEKEVNRG